MNEQVILAIKSLLLPPGCNFAFLVFGYLCLLRWRKLGRALIATSLFALYLLSMPVFANWLMQSLQTYPALSAQKIANSSAQAIVVPTAASAYAPEYGGSGLSSTSLARALYAAALYKQRPLPIVLSGGVVPGDVTPESTEMVRFLQNVVNVPVWQFDAHSKNTYQNAEQTQKILSQQQIHTVYLVTSAWHMHRAMWAFRHVGLDPIPAPTDFARINFATNNVLAWLPSVKALNMSCLALHEYVGYVWYYLYYDIL